MNVVAPKISLLMPTRGRPALVERLFKSLVDTTSDLSQIEIIVYVDDDDTGSHGIASQAFHVEKIIGPSLSMGGYNATCLAKARGDVIVLINDDVVVRTPGWDRHILAEHEKSSDKIYLFYVNDMFKKRGLCTFPVLSRHTCELLVEPYPIAYRGAFIDVHLFDIFKRLEHAGYGRLSYLEHVVFEHLHYRTGKAECDETYRRRGRFADDATFVAHAKNRAMAADRLIAAISGKSVQKLVCTAPQEINPSGVMDAFRYFFRQFLCDMQLPYRWRCFLFYWFVGRYLASRGYLWPLVRHK